MAHTSEDHIIRSIDGLKDVVADQTRILTQIQIDIGTLKTQREATEKILEIHSKTLDKQTQSIAEHDKAIHKAHGWSKGAVWVAGIISVIIPLAFQYLSFAGK